jgi:hypothetical protein
MPPMRSDQLNENTALGQTEVRITSRVKSGELMTEYKWAYEYIYTGRLESAAPKLIFASSSGVKSFISS